MHYHVCFILKAAAEVSLDSPGWGEVAVCMTKCADSGLLKERQTVLVESAPKFLTSKAFLASWGDWIMFWIY